MMNDSGGLIQSYSYLGLDTPIGATHGNGVVENTTLDLFGRTSEMTYNKSGSTIDGFSYSYDADSNVLSKDNLVLSDLSQSYTYDGLNRLTAFTSGTMNETYSLNALGDRTETDGSDGENDYTSNAQNQITSTSVGTPAYDGDGNTTTDENSNTYVYDAWNRLVSVTTATDTIYYTYDALGRRITVTDASGSDSDSHGRGGLGGVGSNGSTGMLSGAHPLDDGYGDSGTTTDLYYSNRQQVIEEQQDGGTTTMQYVFSPFYVNQVVQENSSYYGTQYVEQDANYNVTSLTDNSGNVVERYTYDPYGNVTVLNPDGTVRGDGTAASSLYGSMYLFQGMRLDVETGLYYDRWRQTYDPSLGRFLQPDPTSGAYPDGPNVYQLDISNPVKFTDPTGLRAGDPNDPFAAADEYAAENPLSAHGFDGINQFNTEGANVRAMKQEVRQVGQNANNFVHGLIQGRYAKHDPNGYANAGRLAGAFTPLCPLAGLRDLSYDALHPHLSWGYLGDLLKDGLETLPLVGALSEVHVGTDGCFLAGTLVLHQAGLRPIETIQLGNRIVTSPDDRVGPWINAENYRLVRLVFMKDGQEFKMSFLRPASVVEGLGAGDTMQISALELAVHGPARVVAIEPYPPIEAGLGSVVTGAFCSESVDVVRLKLTGLENPIEVTGNHPIFSEDRHDFVIAHSLRTGEQLRTRTGVATVESIEKKHGRWTVYNLEVNGVNRYYVTEQQVLVHNINGVVKDVGDNTLTYPPPAAPGNGLPPGFVQTGPNTWIGTIEVDVPGDPPVPPTTPEGGGGSGSGPPRFTGGNDVDPGGPPGWWNWN